ncbi:MAG: TspO/MBR family protein [Candidatus Shapirobacteria bacterium]|nr:TspO/MBR family protein [Candidatus Shapirobacteria bacterium]
MKFNLPKLAISLLLPLFVGYLGSLFTISQIQTWYSQINKPSLLPPNGIFGPVWTALYILMGVAFYFIWTEKIGKKQKDADRSWAIKIYLIQLALNLLWSIIFFKFHLLTLAVAEILVLWVMIFFTIIEFRKIKAVTMWLLIPYLAWVTFATYLTAAVWWLN